jgi:hypothetical protein
LDGLADGSISSATVLLLLLLYCFESYYLNAATVGGKVAGCKAGDRHSRPSSACVMSQCTCTEGSGRGLL